MDIDKTPVTVQAELVHILDTEGNVINTVTRAEAEAGNLTTPNVLVFIFNSRGEVLTAQRAPTKKFHPGVWDISACGGVMADEDPALAAIRETEQETGITLEPDGLHHVETFLNEFETDGVAFRRLSRLYIAFSDAVPSPVDGEVSAFKSWDTTELRRDVIAHPQQYVPSFLQEFDRALIGRQLLLSGQTR